MNVRIEGIEYDHAETPDQLAAKIKDALDDVGVDIQPNMMVRFHRSGRPYQKDGKTVAHTIIRFSHWKQRLQVHRSKKTVREKKLPIQIRNDFTKQRYSLMRTAASLLPKREDLFT